MSAAGAPSLLPLSVRALHHEIGGTPLLDGVQLELEAGPRCTVVMGPNGAGKSLLLRLLDGLIAPGAGEIRWNGRPPDDAVRRRIGMVFQRPVLLRRSVRANVDFVLRAAASNGARRRAAGETRRARRVARAAHVTAVLARADLGARADAPARRLSGGEQQRLALACALATDPDVLLLDEPTASLDPASTAAIERLVLDARGRGTGIVLVTHDAGQARRLADAVVFLANGRVTEHTDAVDFFDAPRSSEARDYLAGRLVTRAVTTAVDAPPLPSRERPTCRPAH